MRGARICLISPRHALVRMGNLNATLVQMAHAPAVPDLITATAKVHADLYIAHYTAALPAAAEAARRMCARYAFDDGDY